MFPTAVAYLVKLTVDGEDMSPVNIPVLGVVPLDNELNNKNDFEVMTLCKRFAPNTVPDAAFIVPL